MDKHIDECAKVFLRDQKQLFDEPVAYDLEEAKEFLEDCMAVYCKDIKELREVMDDEDVPGALQKLRTIYPNLMRLEYDNKRTRENREVQAVEAQEQKSELELFGEFYELLNNEPMKEEQTEFMERLIQNLKEVQA